MKKQKGITLVALIITIIVMVILAGVIIASAVADGGIIDRAQSAMKEKERAEAEELVIASYVYKTTASMTTVGTLDLNATADAIYENLTSNGFILMDGNTQAGSGSDILETDKIKLDIVGKHGNYGGTVTDKGLEGNIGIVEENDTTGNENTTGDEDISSKYDEYLQLAKEKGQNIEDNPDIGIGTDGEVLNLDLWYYYDNEDGESLKIGNKDVSVSYPGYKIEKLNNGKVVGKFPQYIYIKERDKTYSITTLESVFGYDGALVSEIPEIPTTVKKIGREAFSNTKITSITIPGSVEIIDSAFEYCENLETVIFSEGIKELNQAFYDCNNLKNIVLPKSLEIIEEGNFAGCGFETITIPSNVKNIGRQVFSGCKNLETVYIEHDVAPEFGWSCFWKDSSQAKITFYFKNNEVLKAFEESGEYDPNTHILSTDFNW